MANWNHCWILCWQGYRRLLHHWQKKSCYLRRSVFSPALSLSFWSILPGIDQSDAGASIWKPYKALPTLYVEPVKNDTECIFESCDDSQSEADLEVDDDGGIYFFPGGEASCPVADFSRSWFEIDEMNSKACF